MTLRRFRDQRGMALPMALGMLMVITITTVAVVQFTASSSRTSSRDHGDQVAFSVAEAAVQQAASVVGNALDPLDPVTLPSSASPGTFTLDGGTATYSGSLSANVWTITARSSARNPAGGAALSRSVTAQVEVYPIAGNEAWNYVYSASTTAPCSLTLPNTASVASSLYTRGNLCLNNGGSATGPKVDVRGSVTLTGTSRVGTNPADASDPALRTLTGCSNGGAPSHANCAPGFSVYTSSYGTTVPDIPKPPVDLAYWRLNAKPGPNQACTTSSGTVPSFTNTGNIEILTAGSYTCQVWVSGQRVGELSWNAASDVLTVKGAIYFDGNLALGSTNHATYTGDGTIYFAGTGMMSNDSWLCAQASCATTGWDPNASLLTFVIGNSGTSAMTMENSSKFQGALYVVGTYVLRNAATMHGPVVANSLNVSNAGFSAPFPDMTALTRGMPVNGQPVRVVPGSWRG